MITIGIFSGRNYDLDKIGIPIEKRSIDGVRITEEGNAHRQITMRCTNFGIMPIRPRLKNTVFGISEKSCITPLRSV